MWGRGFPPAAVGIAAQQNLSAATADGAVGLVAIVVVHVGHFQIHILTYIDKIEKMLHMNYFWNF